VLTVLAVGVGPVLLALGSGTAGSYSATSWCWRRSWGAGDACLVVPVPTAARTLSDKNYLENLITD